MKIGILTLHSGANYGGTLQCLALYRVLKNEGHEVEVIDFRPTLTASFFKRLLYKMSSFRSFKDLRKSLKHHTDNSKNINKDLVKVFDEYRKEMLTFSSPCNEDTISFIASRYDAIVVGSDQVWSSTVRTHLTYMGDWHPQYHGRLYSYAACAVTIKYPWVRRQKIKSLLNRFEALSVRDEVSKAFVEQFLPNGKVQIDLDPTFLYSFGGMSSKHEPDEPYIFVYVLGKEMHGGNQCAIDKIKQIVGKLKVIAVTVYDEDVAYADETIKDATPTMWMNYIKNASFVFTDSFHGEVFSILFKKQFHVYYVEENRASRIVALSKMFHVEDRVITEADECSGKFVNEINFADYEIKREKSLAYIKRLSE